MCACSGHTHPVPPARFCRAPISVLVRLLVLSLCTLLVQGPRTAKSIPVSEFFPFGQRVSDSMTARTDDGGSGKINLTVLFPFFGNHHDKLYVNNNGVISFLNELRNYRPENFPLKEETPLVAVYWADVDIKNSNGTVWYRETRDREILDQATREIKAFAAYRNFRAYWAFVATWDDVGFYGAEREGLKKKNTFQAVLVLDATGRRSFVILNYAKIEWTTGANSQGDPESGLGGSPAQAGFNAGDKTNYFEIEGARTDSVINLTQTSNVGVAGKWIFRIDSAAIQDVCSETESNSIFFNPRSSSMLGGQRIEVIGLCSPQNVTGQLDDGQQLCCSVKDNDVDCYLPPVLRTGQVNVSLSVGNKGSHKDYHELFELKNIMDVKAEVTRHKQEQWRHGRTVTVSWTPFWEGLEVEEYLIELLGFQASAGKNATLTTLSHIRINESRSSSEAVEELLEGKLFLNFSDFQVQVAVVRVTALIEDCKGLNAGPAKYSDVFPVRYESTTESEHVCSIWLTEEMKLPPLKVEGQCPCILRQAEGDTAQYSHDPFCYRGSDWSANCLYRTNATKECIMPNQISSSSGTYTCCYDNDTEELLHAVDGVGGGTQARYYIRQGPTAENPHIVPYFTYMQEEIVPYLHCCEYINNQSLCQSFLQRRRPVDCQGYEPPEAAQAAGDPHIETLDHYAYTFNGNGTFILLRVKDTETEVQVLTTFARDINNQIQNATVFSGIAVRASNTSSTLEIRLDDTKLFAAYVDSEEYSLDSSTSQLNEITVYKNETGNGTIELTVVLENVDLSILVEVTNELLNIMVMAGSQLKGRLEGLLGNYNGDKSDDLTTRDGTTLGMNASMRQIHNDFGMNWSVAANESLFEKTSQMLDPEFDRTSESSETETVIYDPVFADEINDADLPNNTAQICGDNVQCIFDYAVTKKESIAVKTLSFNKRFEETKQSVNKVIRCPYLSADAISNGTRNVTGYKEGDTIVVECNTGFQANGSIELRCTEEGQWSSSPAVCVEKIEPERPLPLLWIAIGTGAGCFVVVVLMIIAVRQKCRGQQSCRSSKKTEGSECETGINLPTILTPSPTPTPVFENSLFMSSLSKLCEKGSFQIPRPTFVDPNIYSEYF